MCLVLFAYRSHPLYPLLLIANRDEFYRRASAPAAPWPGENLVAGRDLEGGGTWAGIARGRAAAVTNVREPGRPEPHLALSRGDIPRDFLTGESTPEDYAAGLDGPRYRGFNTLLFQLGAERELVCAGNRHRPFTVEPGIHGISNGAPDAPWPKVRRGREGLAQLLRDAGEQIDERGFVLPALALLRDDRPAPAADLPHTGVSAALELALSPLFIHIEPEDFAQASTADQPGGYGTRASTVIAVDHRGRSQLWEQSYHRGRANGPLRHFTLA
ncbi:NRDE family protein [Microbulbifer sp. SAOS-129_SWC]|uniref:NRDE family protein n=1 Tax=Microbulbifer sp. SAOS-129_SWC TaxID=3145235 RepID=UPI003216ED71